MSFRRSDNVLVLSLTRTNELRSGARRGSFKRTSLARDFRRR
jgi:hypothetical protein